ncbi:AsmA-like C-terminal region-containing protein [uncultured Martelella sp.]|uniref:AsmA family protein n=1 Tax=uncultured Martelella sp. TaxID=392331 RepID=UPI0029C680BF|nr:AsmA-like C-terminal region-containing protein [uncultured Martelella sp.]
MSKTKNGTGTTRSTRRMSRPRRILLASVLLLGVMVYYLTPYVITPQAMSDGLEQALSEKLGAPARIEGDTVISYWPRPSVTATAVSVSRPDGTGPLVYGNASRLTANFGLPGALLGHLSFSDIALDGAVIILEQSDASQGQPANALGRTLADIQSGNDVSAQANGPDELYITNSTLGFTQHGETTIVKNVNAELDWPVLSGRAHLSGSALLADRNTQVNLDAGQAAAILAGRSSPIQLGISSDTANINFDGTASRNRPYLLDGTFSLSTNALQDLMAKLGVESRLLSHVDNASLNGKVSRSGDSLRFSPVELTIGAAEGNGVLDIVPASPDGPVGISATMAFQDVPLFDAQSSFPAWIDAVATGLEDSVDADLPLPDLDLRVSAGSVRLSDVTLRDVAASIMRTREQTSFDIADSRLDDGSLFAHVVVRNDGTASVRMNAKNVRSGPLFKQLGLSVPLESESFDLEMSYNAELPLSEGGQDDPTGHFQFTARAGNLSWLDLGAILQSIRTSDNFAFSPLKRVPFAFTSIAGRGSVSGTMVHLETLEMETAEGRIRLAGDVDIGTGEIQAMMTTWGKTPQDNPISVRINGNALAALARRIDTPPELLTE